VLARVCHWSLSQAISIQSSTSHPTSLRYILTLYFHLRLGIPSDHSPSGFLTKILHVDDLLGCCTMQYLGCVPMLAHSQNTTQHNNLED
jgi:hypothetical protein